MSILFVVQPAEPEAHCVLLLVLAAPSPALILFAVFPNRG